MVRQRATGPMELSSHPSRPLHLPVNLPCQRVDRSRKNRTPIEGERCDRQDPRGVVPQLRADRDGRRQAPRTRFGSPRGRHPAVGAISREHRPVAQRLRILHRTSAHPPALRIAREHQRESCQRHYASSLAPIADSSPASRRHRNHPGSCHSASISWSKDSSRLRSPMDYPPRLRCGPRRPGVARVFQGGGLGCWRG